MRSVRWIAAALALAAAGCASSKYAVVSDQAVKGSVFLKNTHYLDVLNDGKWRWYKTPEETVQAFAAAVDEARATTDALKAADMKILVAADAEIAALKARPAPACPAIRIDPVDTSKIIVAPAVTTVTGARVDTSKIVPSVPDTK